MSDQQNLTISAEELYKIIGEKEAIIHKLRQEMLAFYMQADEMAKEISRLRQFIESKYGQLEQSSTDDPIRRLFTGDERSGL